MRIQLRYKLSAMEVPRTSKVPAQSWHRANTWQVTASGDWESDDDSFYGSMLLNNYVTE